MNEDVNDPALARAMLRPFLEGDLLAWQGLPQLSSEILNAALGEPAKQEETTLGWYPAACNTYELAGPGRGLAAYIRNGRVVLIEALTPPPLSAMAGLGEPCAIKPHEILVRNAYVHEHLYCDKGLVLSIARPFLPDQPLQLVRCRGVQTMASPDEFGPEYYMAFEDRTVW